MDDATTKRTILIVDDTMENIDLLNHALETQFRVKAATNGAKALKIARSASPPDLILLDIMMPDMSGYEVCEQLSEDPSTTHIPVIFISSLDESIDKIKAFHAGGVDYVVKPFQMLETLARINTHLTLQKAQQDLKTEMGERQKLHAQLQEAYKKMEWRVEQRTKELLLSNKQLRNEINERQNAETKLIESDHHANTIVETALEAVVGMDQTGQICSWNPQAEEIFGWPAADVIGRILSKVLIPERFRKAHSKGLSHFLATEEGPFLAKRLETRALHRGGHEFPIELSISSSKQGGDHRFNAFVRDISEQQRAEKELRHLATYDSLTKLPNRTLLLELLERTIADYKHHQQRHALVVLDLDNFKTINDSLGHVIGDQLLVEVAARLKRCTRESDTIARLGGDEFTILSYRISSPIVMANLCNKISTALASPFILDDYEVVVSASMGIVIFPDHGNSSSTLLRNADTAMYHAKNHGRNQFHFFSSEMNEGALQRLKLEADLRHALEKDELLLHYQPKVDFNQGSIVAMEALVRWQSPERGMVNPGLFIPVAEETGLILPLGKIALTQAVQQSKKWLDQGLLKGRVAVNLSPLQFQQKNLLEQIDSVLDQSGLPTGHLELEITEGAVMADVEAAITTMKLIRKRGIHLSLDDFGTGYSSLSYLKRFPVNTLKIDLAFVRDMARSEADKNLVASIIGLAKNFNLEVVAEGVETMQQVEMLREMGCNQMQGYLFSRAVDAKEFTDLLKEQKNLHQKLARPGYLSANETSSRSTINKRVSKAPSKS